MGVVPPTACEPPRCRGAPRGQALDQGSEREHWGVPLAWGAEDTCHSFRETGPWILLTVTSAGCPFVQLGVPLATADVCRAKPGGCEACSRGLDGTYQNCINASPIFVPELFLTKDPEMIFNEKEELEELIKTMPDGKEKENLRCRLVTIEGEKLERNVYETLKGYYESHADEELIVLHGYEIADLDKLADCKDVAHWEKDFLIINKTHGYLMNIEAKSSLNGKSLKKAKDQLENTKKILEKWFGADLNEGWKFISVIYCERNDKTNKNCKSKMDFIFTGTEDLKEKIEKIHESLLDDSRSN